MPRRLQHLTRLRLCSLALVAAAAAAGAAPGPDRVAQAVLERYESFSLPERQAAVAGLAARPETARRLLEAVGAGTVPRAEIPSFVARQIADLRNDDLTALLEQVWGKVNAAGDGALSEAAEAERQRWKAVLTPDFLKGARPGEGRVLFQTICGTCHVLFGEGQRIGPDLTGSNRADLDYLLENVVTPNAVVGKDYELHVFTLKDGRVIAGMVRAETASAITVQTLTAEEVIPRGEISQHETPGISMMPQGLFTALSPEQVRDLVAYLASPAQVPLPGEAPAPDILRVPGALEGESLKVLSSTGEVSEQKMQDFKDSRWSGDAQLWWRGAKPGDRLDLALPIQIPGRYQIQAVLTRAPDYAVVRFFLDGEPLGQQVDLFGGNVTTTPQITLGERELSAGDHRLTVQITGANPEAVKSHLFGLDYLWLKRL